VAGWARTLPKGRQVLEKIDDAAAWFAAGLAGAVVYREDAMRLIEASCPGEVRLLHALERDPADPMLAQGCVDALLDMIPTVLKRRPTILAAQALGEFISSFDRKPSDPVVEHVACALQDLFDGHELTDG
jgi:hypothetical protein